VLQQIRIAGIWRWWNRSRLPSHPAQIAVKLAGNLSDVACANLQHTAVLSARKKIGNSTSVTVKHPPRILPSYSLTAKMATLHQWRI